MPCCLQSILLNAIFLAVPPGLAFVASALDRLTDATPIGELPARYRGVHDNNLSAAVITIWSGVATTTLPGRNREREHRFGKRAGASGGSIWGSCFGILPVTKKIDDSTRVTFFIGWLLDMRHHGDSSFAPKGIWDRQELRIHRQDLSELCAHRVQHRSVLKNDLVALSRSEYNRIHPQATRGTEHLHFITFSQSDPCASCVR